MLTAPSWSATVQQPVFTLGVASGSPRKDGAVLWTRLAPRPLEGGGMPPGRVQVRYRVALDSAMQRVIRDAVVETSEAKAHSVHVVLRGLEAGRDYWYQFHYGDESSPVGRTRTTSDSNTTATLALASCNHYETGHFAAYADMAKAAPDCVVHVGDYIYEGGAGPLGAGRVRQHNGAEITTLWDYRNRYALYKSDPSLQAAHAASPWLVAFDDHEIDNNWAGEVPQDPWAQTPLEFRVRKRAALQAYYEHMPLEQPPSFNGIDAHLQVYGKYRLGPVDLLLTDTRQYRSDQPCGPGFPAEPYCEQLQDPSLTMTGKAQERWLLDGIRRANARYTVIATQTWFAPYRYNAAPEAPAVNTDQWDGYPLQRQRLIDALAAAPGTPVVLGGDWHCAAAMRIHKDPWDERSARVGHNLCGTSISSSCPWWERLSAARGHNPHVDHVDGANRGYLLMQVGPQGWETDFRVVEDPRLAESAVRSSLKLKLSDT